jgi:hypothetical protein
MDYLPYLVAEDVIENIRTLPRKSQAGRLEEPKEHVKEMAHASGPFRLAEVEIETIKDAMRIEAFQGRTCSNVPPVITKDGFVIDGWHRLSIMKTNGVSKARVYQGEH